MNKIIKISLNKKVISGPVSKNETTSAFSVKTDNTLIIDGEGIVDGNSGSLRNAAILIDGGHVIINGGTFTVGENISNSANPCILINGEGSKLEINGGEFHAKTNDKKWVPIIDVRNSIKRTRYNVSIKGGIFYGYNPEQGDDAMINNFVADGYISIPIDFYTDNKGNKMIVYQVIPDTKK